MIVLRTVPETGRRFAFCTEILRAEGGLRLTPSSGQDGIVLPGGRPMDMEETELPARRATAPRAGVMQRRRVVARLWLTAEKQVDEVESRLSALREDPQALERDAKTLAIIARTVRDLVAIDGEVPASRMAEKRNEASLASSARAFGDFRRELAERLEQLRLERAGAEAP
jgi:hypothetical protein